MYLFIYLFPGKWNRINRNGIELVPFFFNEHYMPVVLYTIELILILYFPF